MAPQLRDQQGASRSVAYLMLAAAPFILVSGFLLERGVPPAGRFAVVVLAVFLAAAGWVCRRRPEAVPPAFWSLAPFLGVALVTVLNVATRDASTGAQLFYLWPVLYSASFLSRRLTYATVLTVVAGHAAVVFPLVPLGAALTDWASLITAFTLTAVVVDSLRRRNERLRAVLERQAFADPLTGVANRRSFDGELARAVARAGRTGEPIALLTLDIDHFKGINDTYGHGVGDRALRAVAEALCAVGHADDDVAGRLGGDEFVLLLNTDLPGALAAADEVRTLVAAVDTLPGGPPGLSIGVAVLPDHATGAEDLVAASDAALYRAKSGGRGRTAAAAAPSPRQNLDDIASATRVSGAGRPAARP